MMITDHTLMVPVQLDSLSFLPFSSLRGHKREKKKMREAQWMNGSDRPTIRRCGEINFYHTNEEQKQFSMKIMKGISN